MSHNALSGFQIRNPKSEIKAHRTATAGTAKELNELRECWLNPTAWTVEKILEFPASMDGPWSRYVDCGGKRSATPRSTANAHLSSAIRSATIVRNGKSHPPLIFQCRRRGIAPR
jgi:hypothetical protein